MVWLGADLCLIGGGTIRVVNVFCGYSGKHIRADQFFHARTSLVAGIRSAHPSSTAESRGAKIPAGIASSPKLIDFLDCVRSISHFVSPSVGRELGSGCFDGLNLIARLG